MMDRLKRIRTNSRIWTARFLIVALISFSAETLSPIRASASQASPENHGDSFPAEYFSGQGEIWEKLETNGEVMVAFPSQIEADISSPNDEDRYSFELEEESDLTLSLESEYPCTMELMCQGQVIGVSDRPYSQILEPDGLEAGTYTVRVIPQEHVDTSTYTLRISRQSDRKKQPDYSEAHIAGTLFDPKSPFRAINIQSEEEKNRGGSPIMAIHYLAHWQGPVDESVVSYYDKGDFSEVPSDYIKYKKAKPNFHVQNAVILPGYQENGVHMEHWKNAIMTYGSIDTGFFTSYNFRDKNEGPGYPDWDFEYFYVPKDWNYEKYGGHATLIVGWDDTVEREKFRVTERDESGKILAEAMPEQDGAWICRDSYAGWMPDYFYVSYESQDFGGPSFVPTAFAPPEQSDNYNHLYSNTSGGMMDVASKASGFIRGVQAFQNEGGSELLRAVGFAIGQGEISYEIGVRIGDGPLDRVKTGYLKYPGFYTARLDQGIMIPPGADFEIHVALSGDDDKLMSFYTCQNVEGWINGIKAIPGKSYYYTDWDGQSDWVDASAQGEYPCIFAYTYSPMDQEITILDNREPAGEIGKATASEADREAQKATASEADQEVKHATVSEADREVKHATVSEADREIQRATASEADRELQPPTAPQTDRNADRAAASNAEAGIEKATASQAVPRYDTASGSNAAKAEEDAEDEENEWEDIILFDDSEEEAAEAEAKRVKEQNFWRIREAESGAIPNDNPNEFEVDPLNLDFPAKYDSRDYHLVTKAKNQGNSNLCWTFSAAGALETGFLRYGNQMIDYPRGLNLVSRDYPIVDGTISLKLRKGEEIPLNLSGALYSDRESFNPGSPQIYWEISGDLGSVEEGPKLSESGQTFCALKALGPGRVTVTAVSMADVSLRVSCQVEILEMLPARVHIEPETMTLEVGEIRNLNATVEADEELTVVYSSDRPDVVSVDKDGRVMALRPGTAVITAKAGEGNAACTITVNHRNSSDSDDDGDWTTADGPGVADTARGSWEPASGQWRFQKEDGTYAASSWERIGGVWYYFKEDTYAASGWFRLGDSWYYLSQEAETFGGMQTGWLYDPSYERWFYLEESGTMAVGWRQIDGKWYYFHAVSDGEMGKMYAGERTPDGYVVGTDGEWSH